MAAATSPAEAKRLAATALQRATEAGATPDEAGQLVTLDATLDAVIAAYNAAKGTPLAATASKLLDEAVAQIRASRDAAIAAGHKRAEAAQ